MKLLFLMMTFIAVTAHAIEFRTDSMLELSELEMKIQWDQSQKEKSFEMMKEAKALALEILKTTFVKNKYQGGFLNQNAVFKSVATHLERAHLRMIEPGVKNKYCSQGVMAFAINYIGDSMNVCPIGLFQSKELLAQIFIHEAVHLAAGRNECKATMIETMAMHFSNQSEALKNGHWETCKTEEILEKVRLAN